MSDELCNCKAYQRSWLLAMCLLVMLGMLGFSNWCNIIIDTLDEYFSIPGELINFAIQLAFYAYVMSAVVIGRAMHQFGLYRFFKHIIIDLIYNQMMSNLIIDDMSYDI